MMTREEAIEDFRHSIAMSKLDLKVNKKNMSIEREIMVLNSIARNEMAIKALEQEPCEDCVSRKDAIDEALLAFSNADTFGDMRDLTIKLIKALPSVTPTRKKGKWIEQDDDWEGVYYTCSVCKESWATLDGEPWKDYGANFCPNCGADMREANNA